MDGVRRIYTVNCWNFFKNLAWRADAWYHQQVNADTDFYCIPNLTIEHMQSFIWESPYVQKTKILYGRNAS